MYIALRFTHALRNIKAGENTTLSPEMFFISFFSSGKNKEKNPNIIAVKTSIHWIEVCYYRAGLVVRK